MAVTVVAVSIGWRCLLLEVERDSGLHMGQIWSAKLEVEWFCLWEELACAKECLWNRPIL